MWPQGQKHNYYEEWLCVSFVLVVLAVESVIYLYMSHANAPLHGHHVFAAAKGQGRLSVGNEFRVLE